MSNFKLNPHTDADRSRIVDWANRHHQTVVSPKNEQGHIEFGFSDGDLKATCAYSDLKRIAVFDKVKS